MVDGDSGQLLDLDSFSDPAWTCRCEARRTLAAILHSCSSR